ncbi:MAG: type VI secretion system tip protein VgrG [Nitrosomonas sp.]|nr:type VI secretion system tip protein VgrG [Nitrosomonas sp.]
MAADFIQKNRFISITTPLGPDKLLLRSFNGTEAISKVFTFQLELLSEDHNIDINNILGQKVTVTINLPEAQTGQRYFNGYINRFKQLPGIGRFARYQAEMVPWLWFLTRTTDCKIFQKEAVPDIVEKIFRQFNFQDFERELQQKHQAWDYCVQYRESACNFVMRLLETEGIFFFFRHEKNRHILVMADSPGAHKPLEPMKITYEYVEGSGYKQEESRIDNWLIDHDLRTGRYAVKDFNFETPSSSLLVNIDSSIKVADNQVYELYDYPGGYENRDEGDKYVRMRMEEEEVEHATIQAEGNCRHFTPGFRFELTGHNRRDQNKQYVITAITHDANIGGNFPDNTDAVDHHYRNRFSCIPYAVPFRPGRHTPKSIVHGTQTAIVVGPKGEEIHTDKFGRVKVQFHWDRYGKMDENSSCWVRVSHPWAGKGWGAVSIPRIGQEVIVDFIEGDPDRPIITGRVYNAETMPPYDLPADGVVSGIKSSTHKGKGYNEMSMNDTAGKEKITIHGQYDMNTTVEHDQTNTVNNKFTETIKSDAAISITEGKYSHDVKTGTANYHVQGALTEKYDATQDTTVKNNITITSTAGAILVNAATVIKLEVGASKLTMDAAGNIAIEGINVVVNGQAMVTIKGGIVHSEAQSEHQTKGAIVLSDGSATNTVKGGVVMLNPV